MAPGTFNHGNKSPEVEKHQQGAENIEEQFSLDATFQKMEKLGIPADIFGNINSNWRVVMKRYYQSEKQLDQKMDQEFDKAIIKIGKFCQTKYGMDNQKLQDCQQQAQLRVINNFHRPKQLSQILLSNFANKCLIRGNTVDFCLEQVIKEKKVINSESLRKLQGIQEYL